jgi:hypothetical protein
MLMGGTFAVLLGFSVELLPERVDLVSLVLQGAGLGALLGQVVAVGVRRDPDAAARVGSLGGAGFGFVVAVAAGLERALS